MSTLKIKKGDNPRLKDLKKSINQGHLVTMNILIDSVLHRKFKVKTTMSGKTMTDILLKAIEDYLKKD